MKAPIVYAAVAVLLGHVSSAKSQVLTCSIGSSGCVASSPKTHSKGNALIQTKKTYAVEPPEQPEMIKGSFVQKDRVEGKDGEASYVLVGKNMRCKSRYRRTGLWGDFGRGLTDKQCQEICSTLTDCNFYSIRTDRGECTSFGACDVKESFNGFIIWEKSRHKSSMLWPQSGADNEKCRSARCPAPKGISQVECQEMAVSRGHAYYDFEATRGCCVTSSTCASKITGTTRPWKIFYHADDKAPATLLPTQDPTPQPPMPTRNPTFLPTPKPTLSTTQPAPLATPRPTPRPTPQPQVRPPGPAPIPPGKENSVCRARPTSRKPGPSYIYNRAKTGGGLCRKPNGGRIADFKYGEKCHFTCNSGRTPNPFTGEGLWITCLGDDVWGDIETGQLNEWSGGGCSLADVYDEYYQTLLRPTYEERICNNPAQAEKPTKADSIDLSTALGKEWSEAEKMEVKQLLFDKFYSLRGRNVFDDSSPTAARILRLGFHDCVKSEDGSGGCDGCIDMKDIGFRIPGNGRTDAGTRKDKPAFLNGNRGLEGTVAWIEKEIFTKILSNGISLQQGGKSRADLWAFATLVAIEFTTGVNNAHCQNPDWHKGREQVVCLQDDAPGCMVTLPRDFVFKSGRRDCQTNLSLPYSADRRDALPSADMSGSQLTAWFKKWFHFTGRETVAIMGAHTVGNFHHEVTGYWYTYTTQAEDAFNNQYYRNLAALDEYFIEPGGDGQGPQRYSCQKSGTADGHRAKSLWKMKAQAAFTNYAPIQWIQYKQVCANCNWAEYGRWPSSFTPGEQAYVKDACNEYEKCQRDGSCEKRDQDLEAKNIMQCKAGTEYERFVWGRDEAATHADMGMYYDFLVDKDGFPYGCEKLDKDTGDLIQYGPDFAKGTWDYLHKRTNYNMDHGCRLQKHAEPCGSKPLHELVEEFAEDKNAWLEVFVPTLERMLENGYVDGELRPNGGVNHLQVTGDAGKDYWMKITP